MSLPRVPWNAGWSGEERYEVRSCRYSVLAATIGGDAVERDFGVRVSGRTVIGSLKLAWPRSAVRWNDRKQVSGSGQLLSEQAAA